MPAGAHREAMELANEATFSLLEQHAYERVAAEIVQAREMLSGAEARGLERGLVQGEAKGKSDAILTILKARGLAVDDESLRRITACAEIAVLDRWLSRAMTAQAVRDVVAD